MNYAPAIVKKDAFRSGRISAIATSAMQLETKPDTGGRESCARGRFLSSLARNAQIWAYELLMLRFRPRSPVISNKHKPSAN